MADPSRAATYALTLRMMERPHAFDFFQAVRRLECAGEGAARVGTSSRLRDDPVRFGQDPSLAFAPSTIAAFQAAPRGGADRMLVSFMGLLGANGPMPLHLTEYVRERSRNARDATPARFLDLFHHRMISLFYRAWAVNQPAVSFDRAASGDDADDRLGGYVASLIGMGMPSLRGRDALPDIARLHQAGWLVTQSRCPEGLEKAIASYFGVPCRLEEFVGRWLPLPEASRTRLGESEETGLLGSTAIAGEAIWDCQQGFRLNLGPLSIEDYERFLPGGRRFERLVAWVRSYVGDELVWDVRLVLRREEVPPVRLGESGRLGWTTWLRGGAAPEDASDLVLASGR